MESVDLVDYEVPWLGPALFNPTLIVELSQGPYACNWRLDSPQWNQALAEGELIAEAKQANTTADGTPFSISQ